MTTVATVDEAVFPLGDLSCDQFIASYWRKSPLVVPGGAPRLLGQLDAERILAHLQLLERVSPGNVERGHDGVVFGQNLDLVAPELRSRSEQLGRAVRSAHVWCDAVHAPEGTSIGCHFDNSDNFNLQVVGTKIWYLASAVRVPEEQLRLSMMRSPEAGTGVPMPDGAMKIVLNPGDLLYIPLNWLHHGVADNESLSLTVTCNSETALGLLPFMHWVLSEDPNWWNAIPLEHSSEDGSSYGRPLEEFFQNAFDRFARPEFRDEIVRRWLTMRFQRRHDGKNGY